MLLIDLVDPPLGIKTNAFRREQPYHARSLHFLTCACQALGDRRGHIHRTFQCGICLLVIAFPALAGSLVHVVGMEPDARSRALCRRLLPLIANHPQQARQPILLEGLLDYPARFQIRLGDVVARFVLRSYATCSL